MAIGRMKLFVIIVFFLACSTVTGAILLLHEPDFYRRSAVPPSEKRLALSNEFLRDFAQLYTNFVDGRDQWTCSFTQDQINSFFEEHFVSFGDADHFRKSGISDPRIECNENQIRFGFRFGEGKKSTILSYDLNLWLAKDEMNVLVVEIQRRRAGALPLPTQQLSHELTELGRKHKFDISWYRHNGNPVAVIKFQTDRPRPTAHLRGLKISPGSISLNGLSLDPAQQIDDSVKKGTN